MYSKDVVSAFSCGTIRHYVTASCRCIQLNLHIAAAAIQTVPDTSLSLSLSLSVYTHTHTHKHTEFPSREFLIGLSEELAECGRLWKLKTEKPLEQFWENR